MKCKWDGVVVKSVSVVWMVCGNLFKKDYEDVFLIFWVIGGVDGNDRFFGLYWDIIIVGFIWNEKYMNF